MKIPLTIKEAQNGLLKKEYSAVEMVDEYLKKIEENKDLNAFITVTEDNAYKNAKEVDKIIALNSENILKDYPLLGSVVSHKDLFLTEGVRTTAASKVLESYIPQYSATAVKRINNSGSIMIGKTNCDAWAMGSSGEHSDFGPTKNPWNKEYVPGGTSSGSAVVVAAGLSLVATGTDTGGSIRQPANFCGVVGIKPTYGVVSRYGVIAAASSLDTIGNFAQTTEDCESVFNVIKGEDGYDSTVKNSKFDVPDSKLKIGIPKEYFEGGLDKEIEKGVLDAIKVFKGLDIEFKEVSLKSTKYAVPTFYIINPAEYSSNLGRYDGIRYGNDRADFGDEAKRRIMLGTYVLSAGYYDAYYLKAQKVRTKIIQDFDKAFGEVNAIIAPVSPFLPFKIGEKVEDPLKMYLADVFTVAPSLAGIPGLSIPFGLSKKGFPLGFQLLGPRFSEPLLFKLGKEFEKAIDYKPILATQ